MHTGKKALINGTKSRFLKGHYMYFLLTLIFHAFETKIVRVDDQSS